MIKKWIFYTSLLTIITFISLGFKPTMLNENSELYLNRDSQKTYHFPAQKEINYFNYKVPFMGNFFVAFKEAVGFKESQGKYNKVNTLGYLGKYQFGKTTLETVGVKDSLQFMNSPKMQEKAFIVLLQRNKYELRNVIAHFKGKVIDGVVITESGILAAAHLGGVGSVKKYLNSNGTKKCRDQYGTSIKQYLEQFAGYETHNIEANKNASIN
jgi:ABC-type antimicrobial peptide transport system permease subunit